MGRILRIHAAASTEDRWTSLPSDEVRSLGKGQRKPNEGRKPCLRDHHEVPNAKGIEGRTSRVHGLLRPNLKIPGEEKVPTNVRPLMERDFRHHLLFFSISFIPLE